MHHPLLPARLIGAVIATLAGLAGHAPVAHAATGAWAAADTVRVRLLAAGPAENGRLEGALEIDLRPGWKTYWRTPGEAGIPPVIDFSASRNVSAAEIGFPPPHTFDDGYAVSNVYEGRVVLPIAVTVTDPGAAVSLRAAIDLGACQDICIPVHLEAAVDIPPEDEDPTIRQVIAEARATLPGAAQPGSFAVESVVRTGGSDKHPEFRLTAVVPDPADAAVLVEGPTDWYPGATHRAPGDETSAAGGRSVFTFAIDRLGAKTPIAGAELRLTLISGGAAVEQAWKLD